MNENEHEWVNHFERALWYKNFLLAFIRVYWRFAFYYVVEIHRALHRPPRKSHGKPERPAIAPQSARTTRRDRHPHGGDHRVRHFHRSRNDRGSPRRDGTDHARMGARGDADALRRAYAGGAQLRTAPIGRAVYISPGELWEGVGISVQLERFLHQQGWLGGRFGRRFCHIYGNVRTASRSASAFRPCTISRP